MPRAEFHVPFDVRDNPDLPSARAHNLDWLERFGLLTSEGAARQYLTMNVADFCSMAHPDARGQDLDTAVDAWSWTAFPDDLFDGAAGRDPELVARICRRFVAIIEGWPHTEPDTASPLETALHDLWGRLTAGMPPAWVQHRAGLWTQYLLAHLDEAGNRVDAHPPRPQDYTRMRRVSIAVWPTLLIERTGRFHVPAALVGRPDWRELHETWIDIVSYVNDVYSLEKDESFGDVNNIVTVLQHYRHLTRTQAIEHVQHLALADTTKFVQLRDRIADCEYVKGLNPPARQDVDRYLTGMGDYASANYFYSRHVPRYSPHGGTTTERLSYVQHLQDHR